jgi:outer membrane protein OmpA-like peptidoglycan-associated protein
MIRKIIILLFLMFFLNGYSQEKIEIFFDFDKYDINDTAFKKLNAWMVENKNIQVNKIYGYCDSKGSNSYNDSLSLKRVNTVYEFLLERKVPIDEDYEFRGFGEDFEQSKIQAANRKVTIIYKLNVSNVTLEENNTANLTERIKASKAGDLVKLPNIYFLNNSARIVLKSKPVLYDLLCAMEENPKLKIEIQGHICCQVNGDFNDVSTARARAIYVFLLRNKIDRKRITYKGYGTTRPVFPIPEKTPIEEEENRRVEVLILEN